MAGCTQAGQVESTAEMSVARLPNLRFSTHAATGTTHIRCQAGMASCLFRCPTHSKVERCDEEPTRSEIPNTLDCLQTCCGSCPGFVLAQCCCEFTLHLDNLLLYRRK